MLALWLCAATAAEAASLSLLMVSGSPYNPLHVELPFPIPLRSFRSKNIHAWINWNSR